MATWVSDEFGKWHPAKEVAGLINNTNKPLEVTLTSADGKKFKMNIAPGAPYTYEGPDRAALFQWWEENGRPDAKTMLGLEGDVTIGEDFRFNSEFREQYAKDRNMFGFNSVEEYLIHLNFDAEKAHKKFEEKASVIAKHDLPARVPEIKKLGGGQDYATGKQNVYGGFGEPAELTR